MAVRDLILVKLRKRQIIMEQATWYRISQELILKWHYPSFAEFCFFFLFLFLFFYICNLLVNSTSFILYRFLLIEVSRDNLELIEFPCPSLRQLILNLHLCFLFIRTHCQRLIHRFFMDFVELIVKIRKHILNLFHSQLFNY